MRRNFIFTFLILLIAGWASAQEKPRFFDDVQTIKAYDKMYNPPKNPVLFTGSSSIRLWNDLEKTFAGYNAFNRGIGGAVVDDITFYLNDVVFPYNPRQIVLYVGENDMPDDKVTAEQVLERFKKLYAGIRAKLPQTPIAYIAMKPSPSRDKWREKVAQGNKLIAEFLKADKHAAFIDIFTPMIKDGKSRPELFLPDMLHMNDEGYAIWTRIIRPYLIK